MQRREEFIKDQIFLPDKMLYSELEDGYPVLIFNPVLSEGFMKLLFFYLLFLFLIPWVVQAQEDEVTLKTHEVLVEKLRDPRNEENQKAFLKTLWWGPSSDMNSRLIVLAQDKTAPMASRNSAVRLLALWREKTAVPSLVPLLYDSNLDFKSTVFYSIALIGDKKGLAPLLETFDRTTDPKQKAFYISSFSRMSFPEVQARLREALKDIDPHCQIQAACALASQKDTLGHALARKYVEEKIKEEDLLLPAIQTLAFLKDAADEGVLKDINDDPTYSKDVQEEVKEALYQIHSKNMTDHEKFEALNLFTSNYGYGKGGYPMAFATKELAILGTPEALDRLAELEYQPTHVDYDWGAYVANYERVYTLNAPQN